MAGHGIDITHVGQKTGFAFLNYSGSPHTRVTIRTTSQAIASSAANPNDSN